MHNATDLQSSDGCTLETQISLEVLGNFSHQTLEGQLADQQLSGFLITTDLTQSHSTGPSQYTRGRRRKEEKKKKRKAEGMGSRACL